MNMSHSHNKPSGFVVCSKMPRAIEMSLIAWVSLSVRPVSSAVQSTCTWWLYHCPLTWVFLQSKAGGVGWMVCTWGSPASKGECEPEAEKSSRDPQCSLTHWVWSLTNIIMASLIEPYRCRKELLADLGAWDMSTARGFSSSYCFCLEPKQHCPNS